MKHHCHDLHIRDHGAGNKLRSTCQGILLTLKVLANVQLKQRLKTTTPYRVMNIRIVLPYIDFVALNVAIFKSVFAFPLDAPVDPFTAVMLPGE